MDWTRGVTDPLSVRPTSRDPHRQQRGNAEQFEREFEEQGGGEALEREPSRPGRRHLREPAIRRRGNDGEMHIDVVV